MTDDTNNLEEPQEEDVPEPKAERRGGWRPTAGRKFGSLDGTRRSNTSKDARTAEVREAVDEAFRLMGVDADQSRFADFGPIECLQYAMRSYLIAHEQANDPETKLRMLQAGTSVAKELAPYVSPKLQSVDVNAAINRNPEQLSDSELLAIIAEGRRKGK